MLAALAVLALLDASAPPDRLRSEALGGSFGYEGASEDRGLTVEVWRNHTLNRTELWCRSDGEYYVKVDEGTWVLGRHDGEQWRTDPRRRIVRRGGAWRPVRA